MCLIDVIEYLKQDYYIEINNDKFIYLQCNELFKDNYNNLPEIIATQEGIYTIFDDQSFKWSYLCPIDEFKDVVCVWIEDLNKKQIKKAISSKKTKKQVNEYKG